MDTLTMNIERRFFADIVDGTKRIEYRRMSPFWKRRIEPLETPFKLRLLNGMTHPIPEAVVVVTRVTSDRAAREFRLHLGRVMQVKRWNHREQRPARWKGSTRISEGTMPKTKASKHLAMMPADLSRRIARLPANGQERLQRGIVAWFGDYDTRGYYRRRILNHNAEFAYNHLHSAPAFLWLAETLGVPRYALLKAKAEVRKARASRPSKAAAARRVLPWALVEALLRARASEARRG